MKTIEILAKVLAELIRRLREHGLLNDADVLALTAILKEVAERRERRPDMNGRPQRNYQETIAQFGGARRR